jgi:hypothetical protein
VIAFIASPFRRFGAPFCRLPDRRLRLFAGFGAECDPRNLPGNFMT